MLPLHLAVVPFLQHFFKKVCLVPAVPTFIQKFLSKIFCSINFQNVHIFFIKIPSSSLKPMFTPNQWHQTVVCYQATCVRLTGVNLFQKILIYVSAKYYSNWFTVGKVITKIKRVNFLLKHGVYYENTVLVPYYNIAGNL